MLPEPEDHVGVEPKCQLLLHWAVERIADSVFPELSRKFRDIGKVDRAVRPLSERYPALGAEVPQVIGFGLLALVPWGDGPRESPARRGGAAAAHRAGRGDGG